MAKIRKVRRKRRPRRKAMSNDDRVLNVAQAANIIGLALECGVPLEEVLKSPLLSRKAA